MLNDAEISKIIALEYEKKLKEVLSKEEWDKYIYETSHRLFEDIQAELRHE